MNTFDRIERFRQMMQKNVGFSETYTEKLILDMDALHYFEAPASVSHHGNYTGGLYDHSIAVTEVLVDFTKQFHLSWQKKRSPYIIGMFHDLCKCDNYRRVVPDSADREAWEYNNASVLPGHGEKSVIMLQQYMFLTMEEMLCIRWHMGAFDDKENWNSYGRAITECNNVLFTHTADMYAARVMGV